MLNKNLFIKGSGDAARSHRTSSANHLSRSRAAHGDEQPHIGKYRIVKTIGKGNFAKVKLAKHVLTGKEVSVYSLSQVHTYCKIENFRLHANVQSSFSIDLFILANHLSIAEQFVFLYSPKDFFLI